MTTANSVRQQAIPEGRYTLVYPDGQYRTVWVKFWTGPQKLVLKLKQGKDWVGCGFLSASGVVSFWRKFVAANPPDRMKHIQTAVNRVLADPEKAGLSYAMQENRCYRCGKELTVPASIHKGMGPDCARRSVTRELNKQAYDWRASQGKPTVPVQTTIPFTTTAHEAVSSSSGAAPELTPGEESDALRRAERQDEVDFVESEMNAQFAEHEREQEERGFMSDPDLPKAVQDKFMQQPCRICRSPRNQCCC